MPSVHVGGSDEGTGIDVEPHVSAEPSRGVGFVVSAPTDNPASEAGVHVQLMIGLPVGPGSSLSTATYPVAQVGFGDSACSVVFARGSSPPPGSGDEEGAGAEDRAAERSGHGKSGSVRRCSRSSNATHVPPTDGRDVVGLRYGEVAERNTWVAVRNLASQHPGVAPCRLSRGRHGAGGYAQSQTTP
jgi:hypothetical protein